MAEYMSDSVEQIVRLVKVDAFIPCSACSTRQRSIVFSACLPGSSSFNIYRKLNAVLLSLRGETIFLPFLLRSKAAMIVGILAAIEMALFTRNCLLMSVLTV